MSKPVKCCDNCFLALAMHSTRIAKLWLELCDAQVEYGLFCLDSPDSLPSMIFLEQEGFLVTTETADQILVKVTGRSEDDESIFFCRGDCEF